MDYEQLASEEAVATTAANLKKNGFEVEVVKTKKEALDFIIKSIPPGSSVINGASKTVSEIGFVEYLKSGDHGWNNLHKAILDEKDVRKQGILRKQATLADCFVGGINAISETGELVIASGTGSQLPSIAYNSDFVFLVAGTQKITPTLEDALRRLREHVLPLEDQKMKGLGYPGTLLSKILLYEKHRVQPGKRTVVILVQEKLGF
jgi:L-lactate utilization protein LutB